VFRAGQFGILQGLPTVRTTFPRVGALFPVRDLSR
jgi:hypothetical protein